jgi:hypothetical protein
MISPKWFGTEIGFPHQPSGTFPTPDEKKCIRVHDLAIVAKNSDICAKILYFPSFFFLF